MRTKPFRSFVKIFIDVRLLQPGRGDVTTCEGWEPRIPFSTF